MYIYRVYFSRPPVKPERKTKTAVYRVHHESPQKAVKLVLDFYPGLRSYTTDEVIEEFATDQAAILK